MHVPSNRSAEKHSMNELVVNATARTFRASKLAITLLVRCLTIGEPIEKENTIPNANIKAPHHNGKKRELHFVVVQHHGTRKRSTVWRQN